MARPRADARPAAVPTAPPATALPRPAARAGRPPPASASPPRGGAGPPDERALPRLLGCAAVLGFVQDAFPDGGLPPGTVVLVLLSANGHLVGLTRIREVGNVRYRPGVDRVAGRVGAALRRLYLDDRASGGARCVLVWCRAGPPDERPVDHRLWQVLHRACRPLRLLPAEVVVSTPAGWRALNAGTYGPPP